jgi:hypothetical protein
MTSDLRALRLDPAQGDRLDRAAYLRDFWGRRGVYRRDSWKFERRQHVEEPDDPSRAALRRGEWAESLRLLERGRAELLQTSTRDLRLGVTFHRVRVVEEPLTPYIQWELHALRVQAECGKKIRVVDAGALRGLEGDERLPEVVVLGGRTLYEVRHTEAGAPCGAVRFTDAGLVERWVRFIQQLYVSGEDVIAYVERRVRTLPPPDLRPGGVA